MAPQHNRNNARLLAPLIGLTPAFEKQELPVRHGDVELISQGSQSSRPRAINTSQLKKHPQKTTRHKWTDVYAPGAEEQTFFVSRAQRAEDGRCRGGAVTVYLPR